MDSATRTEALQAQLQEHYGLVPVPLWGTPRDFTRKTYGGKVARVAKSLGTPLMPWQRYVADVALEVDPETGLLVYRDVVLMVPRQSGKTTLLLAKMIWRANAWARQNILYSAQNRLSARKKWEEEHVAQIEAAQAFRGKFTVRKTNGDEAIRWRNGSRHGITSNTETAGHGETLDDGTIDEAFAHEDGRMEQAFSPAMITRPQPQQWVVSTAGTRAKSHFLNGKRQRGREIVEAARPSTMAFFDWTVPEKYDRADPATWWSCMPALGHTVTEAAVASELEKMDPAEFDRAYLNVTREEAVVDDPNVPTDEWPLIADSRSQPGEDVAFAIDITPDRQSAAIAVYGRRADGSGHAEIVDQRAGTDWVVGRVLELRARHNPIAIGLDVAGPAGSELIALEKLGVRRPEDPARPQRGELAIPSAREAAAACGGFADAVRQRAMYHLDQSPLNAAIAGARTRPLGDAWAWARKNSACDISPLVAATVARWAYLTRVDLVDREPPKSRPMFAFA
ncbi:terminase large subunit domain-containing protein [Prauserella flavalba]|uniref:terminase large subunit domain-containing protein n=1 Tax=Prauserella flavalba TaxID=1477506 RepID=UPI0036E0BE8E